MSPIRPEQRALYPPDWPAITRRIKEDRAGGRCECLGECGSPRHVTSDPTMCGTPVGRCLAFNGEPHPSTGSRVVLTTAHRDHDPANCRDENLAAMCQSCHLHYDKEHHAETRSATRRRELEAAGQLTLEET